MRPERAPRRARDFKAPSWCEWARRSSRLAPRRCPKDDAHSQTSHRRPVPSHPGATASLRSAALSPASSRPRVNCERARALTKDRPAEPVLLLDAYPLIALLGDEPAAEEVAEILLTRDDVVITSVNLAECVDVLGRAKGWVVADVRHAVRLVSDAIRVRPVDEVDAWYAAEIRRRYYDPQSNAISLSDCFLIAVGSLSSGIVTSDPPVARAARAEGVPVIAVPDSAGVRP